MPSFPYAVFSYAVVSYAGCCYVGFSYAVVSYADFSYAGVSYAGVSYAGFVTPVSVQSNTLFCCCITLVLFLNHYAVFVVALRCCFLGSH